MSDTLTATVDMTPTPLTATVDMTPTALTATVDFDSFAYLPEWLSWLSARYDVQLAMDMRLGNRTAASVAGATLRGTTPTTLTGGTSWSDAGMVCAANTALDTGIVPGETTSVVSYVQGQSAADFKYSAGTFQSGQNNAILIGKRNITRNTAFHTSSVLYVDAAGFEATAVVGATKEAGYRNGVSMGSFTPTAWATTTQEIYVGAAHNNGSANNHITGTISAIAITSDTISAADMAELYTRMIA